MTAVRVELSIATQPSAFKERGTETGCLLPTSAPANGGVDEHPRSGRLNAKESVILPHHPRGMAAAILEKSPPQVQSPALLTVPRPRAVLPPLSKALFRRLRSLRLQHKREAPRRHRCANPQPLPAAPDSTTTPAQGMMRPGLRM